MAPLNVLSATEVSQFIADGYILLREAFPRDVSEAALDLIWENAPVDRHDRATWERKRYVVQKSLTGPAAEALYTTRVCGAFDDLLGAGRYQQHRGTGYVLLGPPGFAAPPWQPPTSGWHIDGNHFHHHVNSREQGLVGLFLYTDIGPGGGATVVKPGSHHVTARILQASEPDGLSPGELSAAVEAATQDLPVVEVIGNAGDMVILHPHTYHGSSDNCSQRFRVASNICIGLHEPMKLDCPNPADYSPVERAIVDAVAPTAVAPTER